MLDACKLRWYPVFVCAGSSDSYIDMYSFRLPVFTFVICSIAFPMQAL